MKMKMYRISTFIIVLIGCVQVSFAQIQFKDSTEAYNYWAKRGIIELVYAYMDDYQSAKKTLSEKEKIGKIEFNAKFITPIVDVCDISTINDKFNSVSSFLLDSKYDWKDCEKTVFQPLKKQFESLVQLESIFNLKKKDKDGNDIPIDFIGDKTGKNLNKSKSWNEKISEISYNYNKSLSELLGKQKKPNDSKSEYSSGIDNTKPEEDSIISFIQVSWKTLIIYGGILVIGIVIGSILIYSITRSRIMSIVNEGDERRYDDYSDASYNNPYLFGYLRVVYYLNKNKNSYKKDNELTKKNNVDRIAELEKNIFLLKKENKDLLEENIKLGQELDDESIKTSRAHSEHKNFKPESFVSQSATKKMANIYFSMPESDGSFKISNGEISNDGKKFFRIEFEESFTNGELFYLTGERDQRAINRLDSYLKPVCDIENITDSKNASRIELIHSGKVYRFNDSWIIDSENKIKIKLY